MSKVELLHRGRRLKRALELAEQPQWRARLGDEGLEYLKECRASEVRRSIALWTGGLAILLFLALSSASIDARNWRSALTTEGAAAGNAGNVADALLFELSANVPRGALLNNRSERTDEALGLVGSFKIYLNLGLIADWRLSADGAVLVTLGADGAGTMYDLRKDGARTYLGDLRHTSGFGELRDWDLSGDGRFLMTWDSGVGWVYDLPNREARIFLDVLSEWKLSADGAVLVTRHPENAWAAYDLRNGGARTDLGNLGLVKYWELLDDGALLVTRGAGGAGAMYDLRNGGGRTDLGSLTHWTLSEDGAVLVTRGVGGAGAMYNLRDGGARTNLGDLGEFRALIRPWMLSADGAVLGTQVADGLAMYDLRNGGARTVLGDLGDFRGSPDWSLSADGGVVVTRGADGLAMYDLRNGGARTVPELLIHWELSDDGAVLVTQGADRVGTMYDFRNGGTRTDLGLLTRLRLSEDGAVLVTLGVDGAGAMFDLRNGGARTDLGDLGALSTHWTLSEDLAFILMERTHRQFTFGAVYDLRNGGARADLGLLARWRLFEDGAILVTEVVDGAGVIYDLGRGAVWKGDRPDGARLTGVVCAASGNNIRPFTSAERNRSHAHGGGAGGQLQQILRGRPWNPCDWRGLGAVWPDAAHGDGWFEGPRQWWRRRLVHWDLAGDYTCTETTSKASEETKAARARMCYLIEPKSGAGDTSVDQAEQ